MTTVIAYTSENTGGGCMVDFVLLSDNTFLTLTDEAIIKWNANHITSMNALVEFWYDLTYECDIESESPYFINLAWFNDATTKDFTDIKVKYTSYIHSFPNNKVLTTNGVMIDIDTLEYHSIKGK